MKTARSTLFVLLLASVALVAAACGESDDTEEGSVIVVESADGSLVDASDVDDETTADGSDGTDEEQALAFAQCMRDEGLDFPDPIVNADGSVDFFGGAGGRDGDGGGFRDDAGFQVAIDECGELIDGASFLPGEGDQTDREDSFLEAAQCLRDNGIDVADPDFGNGPGGGGPFGADFDPDDPATADAIDACQDVFTALGGGRN